MVAAGEPTNNIFRLAGPVPYWSGPLGYIKTFCQVVCTAMLFWSRCSWIFRQYHRDSMHRPEHLRVTNHQRFRAF